MDSSEPGQEDRNSSGHGDDALLLDLLDALVSDRGRTTAARALGVNYRTMMNCHDSRRVSRRMRQALMDFRDEGGVGGDELDLADGDDAVGMGSESLEQRVGALEAENRGLRELAEGQGRQLEEWGSRVAALEGREGQPGGAEAETAGVDNDKQPDWRPPRRRPGMPDAGVVTLEEQPDEAYAFGPAAPLVAEWRELRTGGERAVSRVDRTRAAVRWWELEAEMLQDFHLTLPPETEPLDDARRRDHVRWRQEAQTEARMELGRSKRARLLRRVASLGLWRK